MNFTMESTMGSFFFHTPALSSSRTEIDERAAEISNKSREPKSPVEYIMRVGVMNVISSPDRVPLLLLHDINAGVANFGLKPFAIPHEWLGRQIKHNIPASSRACKSDCVKGLLNFVATKCYIADGLLLNEALLLLLLHYTFAY